MNYSSAIFLVRDDVRLVSVSYEVDAEGNGKRPFYQFKTMDPTLAVGDYVNMPTDTRHKMTVARIEEVDLEVDLDSPAQLSWIISKVDTVSYVSIVQAEADAILVMKSAEKNRRRTELREKLIADNPELNTFKNVTTTALPAPAAA